MMDYGRIDLHTHSTVSDGTDTPEELLARVREAGIALFALTDHDAIKGYRRICEVRTEEDPRVLSGVEFSCRDALGKYHILGYNFAPESMAIQAVIALGHEFRMKKLRERLDFLRERFGFVFPGEALQKLRALDNPGKPHIGNLMVEYGFAPSKEIAIRTYIDQAHFPDQYVRPEQAIQAILLSGGIPVLAHPVYGSGREMIVGEALEARLRRLMAFGLQGVEGFYSTFTPPLSAEVLALAQKYRLYVTAGSDYHGANKPIRVGDTTFTDGTMVPEGMKRFFEAVGV